MKCIFESDELKHLCDMVKCPDIMDAKKNCVSACYTCLIEHYVNLVHKVGVSGIDNIIKGVPDAVRKEEKE
jgi:hypothetical protein